MKDLAVFVRITHLHHSLIDYQILWSTVWNAALRPSRTSTEMSPVSEGCKEQQTCTCDKYANNIKTQILFQSCTTQIQGEFPCVQEQHKQRMNL